MTNWRSTVKIRCLSLCWLVQFCPHLVWNTFSKIFGIPFTRGNKRWICSLRSSVQLSCKWTNWHQLKLRRSLYMKMTRSRILRKWIHVNPRKEERIAQSRKFLATSANNSVTGLQSVLKSSSIQGTEVVNGLQRRMLCVSSAYNGGFKRKQFGCRELILW